MLFCLEQLNGLAGTATYHFCCGRSHGGSHGSHNLSSSQLSRSSPSSGPLSPEHEKTPSRNPPPPLSQERTPPPPPPAGRRRGKQGAEVEMASTNLPSRAWFLAGVAMICSLRVGVMAFRSLGPRAAGKRASLRYVCLAHGIVYTSRVQVQLCLGARICS